MYAYTYIARTHVLPRAREFGIQILALKCGSAEHTARWYNVGVLRMVYTLRSLGFMDYLHIYIYELFGLIVVCFGMGVYTIPKHHMYIDM